MLFDDIKKRMMAAMKAGDVVAKEVLRTAIGELTKSGAATDDATTIAVLKKLVKSNRETIGYAKDEAQKATLEREITVLQEFLPPTLDAAAIVAALEPVAAAVREAKSDGQAMGLASKHLKSIGAAAEPDDVKAALAKLRG